LAHVKDIILELGVVKRALLEEVAIVLNLQASPFCNHCVDCTGRIDKSASDRHYRPSELDASL
jgi:hypothetical protein